MSAKGLMDVRIDGFKPTSVHVLIGDVPSWIKDANDPSMVIVRSREAMLQLDFRVFHGLNLDLFLIGDENHEVKRLFTRFLDSLQEVTPAFYSLTTSAESIGLNDEHDRLLSRLYKRYSFQ